MLESRNDDDLSLAERQTPEALTARILGMLLRLDAVTNGVGIFDGGLTPATERGANDRVLSARRDRTLAGVSWSELLSIDLNSSVMKEMLRRGVTPAEVSHYDSTAEIPWNEMLRAPVKPRNLRRLFTKSLKTGS